MRLSISSDQERGLQTFTTSLAIHEMDPLNPGDPGSFLRIALWIVQAMGRTGRLLAASFDLRDSIWHRRLDSFQLKVNRLWQTLLPE
jgi:hypothetical protein